MKPQMRCTQSKKARARQRKRAALALAGRLLMTLESSPEPVDPRILRLAWRMVLRQPKRRLQ